MSRSEQATRRKLTWVYGMLLMFTTGWGCTSDRSTLLQAPTLSGAAPRRQADATLSRDVVELPVSSAQRSSTVATSPEPLEPVSEPRDWQYIVLHHSASAGGNVASIDDLHRNLTDSSGRPWLGIGYHFVIGNGVDMADGQVESTFRWADQLPGAHAGKTQYNDSGIGICLIGNFEDAPPSQRQIAACQQLVSELSDQFDIEPNHVVGHRDVKATQCPGRHFPLDEIAQSALKARDTALTRRPVARIPREILSGDER